MCLWSMNCVACFDCINCSRMCACLPELCCWRRIVRCIHVSYIDSDVPSCFEWWSAFSQSSWIRRYINVTYCRYYCCYYYTHTHTHKAVFSGFLVLFVKNKNNENNHFAAMFAAPSLEKRPIKVPNLKPLKPFPLLRMSTWKAFYQNVQH